MAAAAPDCLSPEALARIADAEATIAGLQALAELVALVEAPTAWATAGQIARQLRRYDSLQIARRPPRTRLEELLAAIAAADLPRTQRNLYELISFD